MTASKYLKSTSKNHHYHGYDKFEYDYAAKKPSGLLSHLKMTHNSVQPMDAQPKAGQFHTLQNSQSKVIPLEKWSTELLKNCNNNHAEQMNLSPNKSSDVHKSPQRKKSGKSLTTQEVRDIIQEVRKEKENDPTFSLANSKVLFNSNEIHRNNDPSKETYKIFRPLAQKPTPRVGTTLNSRRTLLTSSKTQSWNIAPKVETKEEKNLNLTVVQNAFVAIPPEHMSVVLPGVNIPSAVNETNKKKNAKKCIGYFEFKSSKEENEPSYGDDIRDNENYHKEPKAIVFQVNYDTYNTSEDELPSQFSGEDIRGEPDNFNREFYQQDSQISLRCPSPTPKLDSTSKNKIQNHADRASEERNLKIATVFNVIDIPSTLPTKRAPSLTNGNPSIKPLSGNTGK